MSTLHQLLLVVGLFGVPVILLVVAHRIKRRPPRRQRAFWGGVIGHLVAVALAMYASLSPAIGWLPTDTTRGLLGVWSLIALPIVGSILGAIRSPEP
ncbi:MAG: hypothetical protein JNL26_02905 [Gemmatimonadetes bacterium]|nr:hypothetical protein [Gemmatimonadota bacterium]